MKIFLGTLTKLLILVGLYSQNAIACTVCFGDPNSLQSKGINMAVFAMLGIVVLVLFAFAGFFIYLIKKAKSSAQVEGTVNA